MAGNTDASTWPVVLEMAVPFDTKTIGGWYLLLLVTACLDLAYLTSLIFGTSQFIGSCIHIMAVCEHFDLLMQRVQANNEQNLREENPRRFIKTSAKMNDHIRDAIQIHIMIYE